MESERVVEGLDVVEDGRPRFGAAAQAAASEQILGERGEEAVGDGVVVGRGAADRDLDAGFATTLAEEQGHVLPEFKQSSQRCRFTERIVAVWSAVLDPLTSLGSASASAEAA